MIRVCNKCKGEKDIEAFPLYKNRQGGHSHRGTCRECFNENTRDWQLRDRYGLTRSEYEKLIESGCEVCERKDNLNIDHDHTCCPGQTTCGLCIRGVLCHEHNRMEGYIKGELEVLDKMEKYLLKNVNVLGDIS